MLKAKNNHNFGFTLIELIAVIAIVVLLTSFVVMAVDMARKRARDAIIKSSLIQIQAIAETVYNPVDEYKGLYNMRASIRAPILVPADHRLLAEIKKKISDIGYNRQINLFFPEDSINPAVSGHETYCAYVFLFYRPNEIFCVDSTGFARNVDVRIKEVNCQKPDNQFANCQYVN